MAAHQHWRVRYVPHSGATGSCGQLGFRTLIGGPSVATGGTASANSEAVGFPATNAFDGNPATVAIDNGGTPKWFRYSFAAPVVIREVAWQARQDALFEQNPSQLFIEWSDDGTNWTTDASFTSVPAWSLGQTRLYRTSEPLPDVGLVRSKSGLIFADDFNRATLGLHYAGTSGGTIGITGNKLRISGNNQERHFRILGAGNLSEAYVQADSTRVDSNSDCGIIACSINNTNWYLGQLQLATTVATMFRMSGGYTQLHSEALTMAAGVEFLHHLYWKSGELRMWINGAARGHSTDSFHGGAHPVGLRGATNRADFDNLFVCRNRSVVVADVPSGHSARIKDSGGTVIASASEAAGIAIIDVSGLRMPFGSIEVVDGSTVVEAFTGAVFAGDEFLFVAPPAKSELSIAATLPPLAAAMVVAVGPEFSIAATLPALSAAMEVEMFAPDPARKAWAFTWDGHVFYVLADHQNRTLLYDVTTGQWCLWSTNRRSWNMKRGIMWRGRVLAVDTLQPRVYLLDSDAPGDYGGAPIERTVTGLQPHVGRSGVRVGSVRLTASVGSPDVPEVPVRLRYSDDEGDTWSRWYEVMLREDDFAQVLRFRSLGTVRSPGRLWEIRDSGGLTRIDDMDADLH